MSPPEDPHHEAETASSYRFAWRLVRADPAAWLIALGLWMAFFLLPLATGLALKGVLDRLPPADGDGIWLLLAAVAGIELARWLVLLPAIVQWHGAFVLWKTVPRVNALRSLTQDPGPVTDRLPSSPGEAVSRLRDDTEDLADVVDTWLDMVAAIAAAVIGLTVLVFVFPPAALATAVPVAAVLWLGAGLANRLRGWRLAQRRATAAVTGFIGDTFGSIAAVKVAAAEDAVLGRFAELGERRARFARRDEVGTQLTQVMGGITANAGLGLALVLVAPALQRGELSVGDVGLFSTYVATVAGLPRVSGRWAAMQRQGEVGAARLGRLMVDRDPDQASAPVTTYLRHGPGPPPARPVVPRHRRVGADRFERLSVRDLRVSLDGSDQLAGVGLDVTRGQLVVITGPVGAGKSMMLRALLGLVPRASGTITWNGSEVADPSVWFVPPRAAYVPQVPRLFSEPLAEGVLLGLDDAGLADALSLATLDEDLAELPDGIDTAVGPKGVRLSGGQVQRTAAARALVRQPELLVVDDLSSALDGATETRLWDGLFAAASGDLTVLAISHRPRVLERADVVVRLEGGRTSDRR